MTLNELNIIVVRACDAGKLTERDWDNFIAECRDTLGPEPFADRNAEAVLPDSIVKKWTGLVAK